jgi:2-oxoisovalerate dehydrogenase E2 component (dihydrolipoyl transacylase)
MDVPSPITGTLIEILASEGETVLMGAVIAEMEPKENEVNSEISDMHTPADSRIGTLVEGANVGPTGGEFLDTSLKPFEPTSQNVAETTLNGEKRQKGFSPVVSRLATQHGVDLNTLTGTGLGGRVTKKDVLAAVEYSRSDELPILSSEDRIVEPTAIRKMISDHMVKSMSEIPHAWSAVEVDVTGMVDWRTKNRLSFEKQYGVSLTYLPITLHVVAAALTSNEIINSTWSDDKIVIKGAINIGVAVAASEGLIVPVIHQANDLSIVDVARALDSVIKRARDGSTTLDDVQGGTFTLNNTGALGSVWGGAIINHPQAAILTTEAIVKRPVVVSEKGEDMVRVHSMMNICLSFDHRIIDGAEASKFLQAVKLGLESIDGFSKFE